MAKARIFRVSFVDPKPGVASWGQFMHISETLHDRNIYARLQTDMIEHIWAYAGNQYG
jgi:hypothetical protein